METIDMKRPVLLLLLVLSLHAAGNEPIKTDTVSFTFEGKRLTGLLDMPADKKPAGLILLIPGSGRTSMIDGNGYYKRLRHFFARQELACYVWDKPGCGRSEGRFDDNNLQNSALEAIAAIEALKSRNTPGSDHIGLWSLSRGGWVSPLIISHYPSIAFWISVSGPEDKDNSAYLLESNFRIEGKSEAEAQLLLSEWKNGNDIFRKCASFEAYQQATAHLRKDSFWLAVSGDPYTKEGFERNQKNFMREDYPFDEATGLRIYMPGLEQVLCKVSCPVLAIFGEKDTQVDWQKTVALYQETIGKNPQHALTIRTFPDGNHNLFTCKTGGMREKLDKIAFCEGYFDTMATWLKEK